MSERNKNMKAIQHIFWQINWKQLGMRLTPRLPEPEAGSHGALNELIDCGKSGNLSLEQNKESPNWTEPWPSLWRGLWPSVGNLGSPTPLLALSPVHISSIRPQRWSNGTMKAPSNLPKTSQRIELSFCYRESIGTVTHPGKRFNFIFRSPTPVNLMLSFAKQQTRNLKY
jgi:hypothetical protein